MWGEDVFCISIQVQREIEFMSIGSKVKAENKYKKKKQKFIKNTQKFSEIDLICEIRGFIYKLKQYIHQYLLNSISSIPNFGAQCSECLDFTPFLVNIPLLCSLVFRCFEGLK